MVGVLDCWIDGFLECWNSSLQYGTWISQAGQPKETARSLKWLRPQGTLTKKIFFREISISVSLNFFFSSKLYFSVLHFSVMAFVQTSLAMPKIKTKAMIYCEPTLFFCESNPIKNKHHFHRMIFCEFLAFGGARAGWGESCKAL